MAQVTSTDWGILVVQATYQPLRTAVIRDMQYGITLSSERTRTDDLLQREPVIT